MKARRSVGGARSLAAAMIALLIAAAATASASPAATSDTEVISFPFTDSEFNPCVDELVETTGILHVMQHTTTTSNGRTDSYSSAFTGMTATGLISSVRYVETMVEEESDHTSSSGIPMEFTHTETLVLNRLGEGGAVTADDYIQHAEAHMTISASGVVTLKSFEFKPECR
jgi:hypothetical protein